MTKRDIVKVAVNYAVSGVAASAAESTIENYTDITVEDNLPVRVGVAVFGVYVASQLKPFTNNTVDKIADHWIARKERKLAPAE